MSDKFQHLGSGETKYEYEVSQPDFYRITITYIPDRRCLESKSLKLYLFSYRQSGMFAEDMANRILDDLVKICRPRWLEVESEMNPRGGAKLLGWDH
jgi:7-cyano-7-deazaguanine reductase